MSDKKADKKPELRTAKKVKVIGTQDYINPSTGEVVSMQVTSVEERDFDFTKVWMRSFLATLDLVGNAKTRVAFWVVEHITKENLLLYTYRQIAHETGMSLDTVTKTMTVLLEADFLRRKNQGCYIVNPDIVFKGARQGRLNVLTQFKDSEKTEEIKPTPQQRLEYLLYAINQLTQEANRLTEEIKKAQETPEQQEEMPGQTTLETITAIPGLTAEQQTGIKLV